MTDDLEKRLRDMSTNLHWPHREAAADRIKALTAERDARIDPAQVQALVNAAEPMLATALASAEAERDRLAHVIDNRESHYGISSNGSMWRFWADEARKGADENKALTAERDRLAGINVKLCDNFNTLLIDGARLQDRAEAAESERDRLQQVLAECAQFTGVCGETARTGLKGETP